MRKTRTLHHESLEIRRVLDASGVGAAAGEPVDDYSLVDQNPNSSTFNQTLTRQDFTGTTAYYFMESS